MKTEAHGIWALAIITVVLMVCATHIISVIQFQETARLALIEEYCERNDEWTFGEVSIVPTEASLYWSTPVLIEQEGE